MVDLTTMQAATLIHENVMLDFVVQIAGPQICIIIFFDNLIPLVSFPYT